MSSVHSRDGAAGVSSPQTVCGMSDEAVERATDALPRVEMAFSPELGLTTKGVNEDGTMSEEADPLRETFEGGAPWLSRTEFFGGAVDSEQSVDSSVKKHQPPVEDDLLQVRLIALRFSLLVADGMRVYFWAKRCHLPRRALNR